LTTNGRPAITSVALRDDDPAFAAMARFIAAGPVPAEDWTLIQLTKF
jgi:hypothetical protein